MQDIAEAIVQVAQQRHQAKCLQSSCQIALHFGDMGGSAHKKYRIMATPREDKIIMEFHRLPTGDRGSCR